MKSGLSKFIDRKLIVDLISTTVWQATNYIIPLITFPYLARTLGTEGFGVLGLAGAAGLFGMVVVDWGFSLTGTQLVARSKDDPLSINTIISSVFAAKLCLAVLVSIALTALSFFFPVTVQLCILAFLIQIYGSVFSFDWVLRGTGRFQELVIYSLVGKLLSVPIIVFGVQSKDDVVYAALASASMYPISALLIGWTIFRSGTYRLTFPGKTAVVNRLKEGAGVFTSTASGSVYNSVLPIILAHLAGFREVALFSGVDKIRRPIQNLSLPIMLVMFPRISLRASKDVGETIKLVRKLVGVQFIFSLFLSVGFYGLSEEIIYLVLGDAFSDAVFIAHVFAIQIGISGLNGTLGTTVLLALGHKKEFTYCLSFSVLVSFLFSFPLCLFHGGAGAATSLLILDSIQIVGFLYFVQQKIGLFSADR